LFVLHQRFFASLFLLELFVQNVEFFPCLILPLLQSCLFVLITFFFIVLIVALFQSSTYNQVDGVQSTPGNVYPVTIQCLSDAVPGDIGPVYCLVDVTYNYTYTELIGGVNVLVQHPCNRYSQNFQIYRGYSEIVYLCNSPGIDDGIVITTTPNVNKAVIYELSTDSTYAIPQQSKGRFELSVTRIQYRDEDANGNIKITSTGWDLSPLTINRDPNAVYWNYTYANVTTEVYNSTSILRTSSTFLTVTNQEEIQTPSIGTVGGSAFLLWLAMKMIVDVHIRCTKPYKGQLEPGPLVPVKKRRRTRSM